MQRMLEKFRVTRASRPAPAGAMASPPSRTFSPSGTRRKDRFGETPKSARETRALAGPACSAFTIIELLIVMTIVVVLAGLIIATSGYVQEKGKRSRTEAELAAISAALESYKADNGIYPTDPLKTETVDPMTVPVSPNSSLYLYGELTGDTNFDGSPQVIKKTYMPLKPASLQRGNMSEPIGPNNLVTAIRDPFGDPYGYSTMKATDPTATGGYNPTYDLWSTAGAEGATGADQLKWIKNW